MKLSELIAILTKAKSDFGDVETSITNGESGYNELIRNVSKVHPYTAKYVRVSGSAPSCMNRDEPVNQINLSTHNKSSGDDLILNP